MHDHLNSVVRLNRRSAMQGALLLLLPSSARANLGSVAEGWNNDAIEWFDFEDGSIEAKKTGKPILVVIHATWCPFCKQYRQQFYDPRVVDLAKSFVMIMMDRDLEKAETAKLGPGANYIPRTLIFRADGTMRPEIKGANPEFPHWLAYTTPDELIAVMKAAIVK